MLTQSTGDLRQDVKGLDPRAILPYTTPSATAPDSSGASLLRGAEPNRGVKTLHNRAPSGA